MTTYQQTPSSAAQTAFNAAFQVAFGMAPSDPAVNTISASAMTSFLSNQFAAQFTGASWTSNWSAASDTPTTSRIAQSQTTPTSVSANQPAFQQLTQAYTMVSELGGLNLNATTYQAVMGAATTLINTANNSLTNLQTSVGVMQENVKNANSALSLQSNVLTTQIGNFENVNSYDVASQVSALSTQLQTAYSLTSQINSLSLVKFLPVG